MSVSSRFHRTGCRLAGPIALVCCASWSTTLHAQNDLLTVYERALAYDATLQAAAFDLEAARERVPIARSAFRPQLSAGADATQTWADTEEGSDDYTSTLLSLSVNQSLFNRPNAALLDQAEINVMGAEAAYVAAEQELVLRVATLYFDVLRAQANLEFSESELEAISRQLEQAQRRFDVGLVPITDVRDAQAQFDLAQSQEIIANNQVSTAREALRRISGVDPESLAELADDLPLEQPQPAEIDRWVETAVDRNLGLSIARFDAQAAREQIRVERGARLPTLDIAGSAASSDTEQPQSPDADTAELALQLRLPIYTGGRIDAQVAQARAQALASAETLIDEERATIQQTRDAYRGVLASISQVQALRQALTSTQQSSDATEAGFRAGTRTSVDVLRALRDVFRARSDYAAARYDYIINSLQLESAVGSLGEADLVEINRFLTHDDENTDP